MRIRTWLAAGVLVWTSWVQAAGYAVVDAVQAPVWVERGSQRQAVAPGMELRNHDRLVTGAGARAAFHLVDGSAVKLGENAQLSLNALGWRDGKIFTAALDLAAGAFRLTADPLPKGVAGRAINLRAGTVTAGLRSTESPRADIWGSSDAERDLLCLLDGRVIVSHPEGEVRELSEPRQVYAADKGKAPGGAASVDQGQLSAWAALTDFKGEMRTARRGGRWAVSLGVVDDQAAALSLYDRAVALTFTPKITPRRAGSEPYRYELWIDQMPSQAEAQVLATRLARELGLDAPRVVRR